jgi:hypothetical protein
MTDDIKSALAALYEDIESTAITSFAELDERGNWIFNDTIWQAGDKPSGFLAAVRAREALALEPLNVCRREPPDEWPKLR